MLQLPIKSVFVPDKFCLVSLQVRLTLADSSTFLTDTLMLGSWAYPQLLFDQAEIH